MQKLETILNNELKEGENVYPYEYVKSKAFSTYYAVSTEEKNGVSCHHITTDLMISILKYHYNDNVKINMYVNYLPYSHQFPDDEIPLHYNDFIELTYVLQGHVTIELNGARHTFCENEIYMINPNFFFRELKKESDAIVFNISLSYSFFDEILLSNIAEDSLQGFLRRCLISEKNHEEFLRFSPQNAESSKVLSELLSNILLEGKARKHGYMYFIKGSLIRLMDYLVENYDYTFTEAEKEEYKEHLFYSVKNYIKEHYSDIHLRDLSEIYHYHENYFNKLIQNYTGMNFSDYLIEIRLEEAKKLLEITDLTIEEIMIHVGYRNKGFFYKQFKAKYGSTPAAYRKLNVKKNSTP